MARRTSGSLMFNQKKEQKKMKKFWNLMLAALVIIGAAACTENYEGVDVAESLSFYAEIGDDTRAYIEKDGEQWKTTFEGDETLYVDGFPFTNTKDEPGKFTCTAVGVSKLAGANVTITTDGNHHSLEGASAFYTTANVENFGAETVKLQALTSFFRFTYNGEGEVTLTLSEPLFRTEEGVDTNKITVSGSGEQFVAFWPNGAEAKLTFSANGETKEVSKAFAAGMVYNLGDRSPVYKVYVHIVNNDWPTVNLYSWCSVGGTENHPTGDWPGSLSSATEKINGYDYLVWTMPTYVNTLEVSIILNSESEQTPDFSLGKLNSNHYLLLNGTGLSTIEDLENPVPKQEVTYDLYLKPNSNWKQSNAWFAAYFWYNGKDAVWVAMTDNDNDAIYEVNFPAGHTYGCNVIFCRMNSNNKTALNWNNVWNQTSDLTTASGKNLYTIATGAWSKGSGTWSKM